MRARLANALVFSSATTLTSEFDGVAVRFNSQRSPMAAAPDPARSEGHTVAKCRQRQGVREADMLNPEISRPESDYIIEFTESFRIHPARTALVVIDLQYATASWEAGLGRRSVDNGTAELVRWRFDRIDKVVIPNLKRLIAEIRARNLKVIYVTSGSTVPDYSDVAWHFRRTAILTNNRIGTREHEIRDEVRPESGDIVINKSSVSAIHSSNLDSVLRTIGVEYLLFSGVSTNTCVDTTARDAVERGFRTILVADCCSAAKPEYHQGALINFQRIFGRVENTQEIIDELGERAGVGL